MNDFEKLVRFCRRNSWDFTLDCWNGDYTYSLRVNGIWYVRGTCSVEDALTVIKEQVLTTALDNGWNIKVMGLDLCD